MSGKPFSATPYDILMGRMLATMRMRLGLSQKDIAEKAGISFQQIQKYETGGNRITAGRLYQIVTECFGITISEFMGEANNPHNPELTNAVRMLDNMNPVGQKLALQIIECIATTYPKSAMP